MASLIPKKAEISLSQSGFAGKLVRPPRESSMFSQTTEYALRAALFLANLGPRFASADEIAEGTQVPSGYLSKVMRDLVLGEIVNSQRGPNGGFVLARPAAEITILDVVNAVDPIRRITACPLGNPMHVNLCPLHEKLDGAIAQIERAFSETTLAQLVQSGTGPGRCGVLLSPIVIPAPSTPPKNGA
ncbi:Putative HTH-type transcriptional regulator [Phycisphaerales bacterium]|nr:Putative HTH-type transcriptional regulator [Phycisphaerales bacterium]